VFGREIEPDPVFGREIEPDPVLRGSMAPEPVVDGATGTAPVVGGTITGRVSVGGSRPTAPLWCPTWKVSLGPSGLPMLIAWPSRMSTIGTRWPLTNRPLRELLSIAIHRP